jgi:threonine/homoserine/homoserine lactone efflux protein
MFEYFMIGFGFAFGAVVQPGPLQAFLLSSVAQKGWKRTLPASLSPLISDGPAAFIALFVLSKVPIVMSKILQAGGGVFLLYLAWAGYRQWKHQVISTPKTSDSAPPTLMQAVIVNMLNPNPYLGWSLILGPAVLKAWYQNPIYSVVLIVSFYTTIVVGLAGTIILLGTTRFLGASSKRTLILVSAATLALLGTYLIIRSFLL